MKKTLTVLILICSTMAFGQSDKEKAHNLGMEALTKMDAGQIDESIVLLKEAEKLDPKRLDFPYEIGYAQMLKKDYKAALKIFKKLLKHTDVNSQVYQMLGNCYDYLDKPELSIATYEEGIEKFPAAGNLYLERGNMELAIEEYNNALVYYEKGIEVQPRFPSNYYWAAKIFLNSDNEVWGMIYGEIFVNLERNTRRTQEISSLLFKTYKSEIQFTSDTTSSVSFSSNKIVVTDLENLEMPYGIMVYEPLTLISIVFEKEITLASLARIRASFANGYVSNAHNEKYPNPLFEFHTEMIELGYFEAYSYWVLLKGDEEEFGQWRSENQEDWDKFVKWFSANPIDITLENKFYRTLY